MKEGRQKEKRKKNVGATGVIKRNSCPPTGEKKVKYKNEANPNAKRSAINENCERKDVGNKWWWPKAERGPETGKPAGSEAGNQAGKQAGRAAVRPLKFARLSVNSGEGGNAVWGAVRGPPGRAGPDDVEGLAGAKPRSVGRIANGGSHPLACACP